MGLDFQSLLLGIAFSLGLYAVKTGLGLQYYLEQEENVARRLAVFLGFLGAYGLFFAVLALGVHFLEVMAYFHYLQILLKSGMLIHLLMACLMLAWGLTLLKNKGSKPGQSRGWLMLVMPCPVCFTIVLLSIAALVTYFPDTWKLAVFIQYASFMAVSFLSTAVMWLWRCYSQEPREATLGAAMVGMAGYFILSILIMPQFAGLDEAFRLSAFTHHEAKTNSLERWATFGMIIAFFISGYFYMSGKLKRSK